MKPRTKQILNFVLIFGTFLIVLAIGISDNNLGDTIRALRTMNPGWVALCALAFVAFVFCDTLSIMYFLSRQGYRVPLRKVLFTSLAGQYYSNITPGASGGQPMQIYYLHKENVPTGVATSSIVMRFVCYQLMLSVIGTVLWIIYRPFVAQQTGNGQWILIVGYVYNLIMVTLVITLALWKNLVLRLADFGIRLARRWIRHPEETRERLHRQVESFHGSVMAYRDRPLDFLIQLLIGGLQLMCLMSIVYFIYRGMNLDEYGYWPVVTMSVMEYLAAAYTPLPGASGAQEGVFSMYFDRIFPNSMGFAALLLWRFFTYYISIMIGFVAVLVHGMRSGSSIRETMAIDPDQMKKDEESEVEAEKAGSD